MYQAKKFKINYGGKEVILETGRMAKQTDGAVFVSCEGTEVLVTVCSAPEVKDGQDFFPLQVDYNEKFYAAGKFLGGFNKRETRPSTAETLNARLIDRPLRPLFPEGFMFDTFIQATCYSYSPKADPEVLASLGASAALCISAIPFSGPLGACKVGLINGQFVLNPEHHDWTNSSLELVVAATKDAIMMVEGEALEVDEATMLKALDFAHENIRQFCTLVDQMVKEVGKSKRAFTSVAPNEAMMNKVRADFSSQARQLLSVNDKVARTEANRNLIKAISTAMKANPASFGLNEDSSCSKEAAKACDELLYKMMRSDILNEDKRIGGRPLNKVRSIKTEVDILTVPHGSALFTRGETQVLSTVTLGGKDGEQMVDSIRGLTYDKFYLHYTFPPFSVGESRGVFKVGRRELGHGNLAERALKKIVLQNDAFPYTIRITCDVLESNGSSSMGSVCAGSMALMAAGVPMKGAVAGVAMGLVKEKENFKILTDILGDEDHLGDMDFKVAGTEKGISAIQMDIKITGINRAIMEKALSDAKAARTHILKEMAQTIPTSRNQVRETAPKILTINIAPDKIGALIGPGGKVIKELQERFTANIDIAEDGLVRVGGHDLVKLEQLIHVIDLSINGPKEGTDYNGRVVTMKEYGAFVDIAPGVSGLLHVSEITNERVKEVGDYLREGDDVMVRVMEVDRFGKIRLSAKAVKPLEKRADH
jgi:polyribonucleotide nucleotidyltransferase